MPQHEVEEFITPIGDRLPEGSIPEYCIYVVGFLDKDGERKQRWFYDGEASFDTLMAGLEKAKLAWALEMLEHARPVEEDED